jgi:hypothetical protein
MKEKYFIAGPSSSKNRYVAASALCKLEGGFGRLEGNKEQEVQTRQSSDDKSVACRFCFKLSFYVR